MYEKLFEAFEKHINDRGFTSHRISECGFKSDHKGIYGYIIFDASNRTTSVQNSTFKHYITKK